MTTRPAIESAEQTDLDAYFRRIGYDGGREPTIETLRGMVRAHFYHVPFENLDIGGDRLILAEDGGREERDVTSDDDRRQILREHFGITVP